MIKTPYIPHLFGEAAQQKLKSKIGWLTVGVASSIPWPPDDVWVLYDKHEYVLRGTKGGEDQRPPCISTPCGQSEVDAVMTRVYLFASVLGWFKGGHVDVTGYVSGSRPVLYGSRETFTTTLDGSNYFSCNYMPIINDEKIRKALAFLREGRRLRYVHEPYSFLSYFKVIESQFSAKERIAWIQANLDYLEGNAFKRVVELRKQGVDVCNHLYGSGRCAVAHASLNGAIIDPDIPADRRRIADDLDVMAGLASRYLKVYAGVPDDMELYENRDRTIPWHALLSTETLKTLQAGGTVYDMSAFNQLQDKRVSVRLWPQDSPECMRDMRLYVDGYAPGVFTFLLVNDRSTIFLHFAMDVANGQVHTMLEDGGITDQYGEVMEADIEHYTRYFHSATGNALVELCIDGCDPVPCEIVIPFNIIPQAPEKMVALELDKFHKGKKSTTSATPSFNNLPNK